jgi:polar amino acid transport system substrate-binding protein
MIMIVHRARRRAGSVIAPALGTFAVLAVVALVAACGEDQSNSEPAGKPPAADARVAREVPEKYASKGMLTVATSADYAPVAFVDGDGGIVGLDPDIARAVGAKLGLDVKVVNTGFDGILAGLDARKYDIVVSGINDTKEREKRFDFVTYFKAGTALYATTARAGEIAGMSDLCGRRVGVARGTIQQTYAAEQDRRCNDGGEPRITVQIFPDQNAATLALRSGRIEVAMADSPVAAHVARQSSGQLAVAGDIFAPAPYGIAVPKDSGLAEPLRDAINELIADGTYHEILAARELEAGALERSEINAPTD